MLFKIDIGHGYLMSNQKQIIEWASQLLVSKGCLIEHSPQIVVETPWSMVIRFLTSNGCFYLKQTPPDLFIESEIIKTIHKNISDSPVPTILFKSDEFNCFLMNSCGDYSLRTKFNGIIDPDRLIAGLNSYIKILRAFEKNHDDLEAIGVPNWHIDLFPDLFVELIQKKKLLLAEGLTETELSKLMKLVPIITSVCECLSKQTVRNTLVNGDFNENNLIVDEQTQHICIVDWGESVITHPFFTIASHLRSCARRYKLDLNGPLLEDIKQKCLSCWSDVANIRELNEIYQNILRLHPIFAALAICRLQVATDHKSKQMQNWFIADFLRALLENNN